MPPTTTPPTGTRQGAAGAGPAGAPSPQGQAVLGCQHAGLGSLLAQTIPASLPTPPARPRGTTLLTHGSPADGKERTGEKKPRRAHLSSRKGREGSPGRRQRGQGRAMNGSQPSRACQPTCWYTRHTPGSGQTRPGALPRRLQVPSAQPAPHPCSLHQLCTPGGVQSKTLSGWVPAPGHTTTTAVCSATQTPVQPGCVSSAAGVINRPRPASKVLQSGGPGALHEHPYLPASVSLCQPSSASLRPARRLKARRARCQIDTGHSAPNRRNGFLPRGVLSGGGKCPLHPGGPSWLQALPRRKRPLGLGSL